MNTIGNRLDLSMKEAGFKTQHALAVASKVPQPTISRVLSGRSDPEAKTISPLAVACGVSTEWLMTGRGDKYIQHAESRSLLPSTDALLEEYGDIAGHIQELLESVKGVSEDEIQYALAVFRHEVPARLPSTEDEHLIPRFDVAAKMGDSGYITEGHVGVITDLKVDSEWLRNNLKGYTSTKNLGVVTGFGESMKPLFNPGDPLIIDTSVVEFIGDFPYLFRIGNELFIKRIQRVPGSGFIALSDNRNYRDWPITPEMDFAIIGKVIKVWRSEDF